MSTLFQPEILYADGCAIAGAGLLIDDDGMVSRIVPSEAIASCAASGAKLVSMPRRALLPAFANAHSHAFQRLFRARAEGRKIGGDTFWTWREQMYRAAAFVDPDQMYAIARAVFLEMAQTGIALVGEFHYVHRDREGRAYDNPNALAESLVAAARSVGIRITLLRSAYFRAGYGLDPHPGQSRFYEQPAEYLENLASLAGKYGAEEFVRIGAAPHSIRAVSLSNFHPIVAWSRSGQRDQCARPLHLHISEQPAENEACLREYGATPVTLLAGEGLLDAQTTLVHAIHVTEGEMAQIARGGSTICSCPTTERNLGDGIFPADTAMRLGVPVAFGSDSQAQIDPFEDARQLEYHLRLRDRERGILDGASRDGWRSHDAIGTSLLRAMTANGYRALGVHGGRLAPGEPADFLTLHTDEIALLGADADSLAAQVVFAASKSAVDAVYLQGRRILHEGRHPEAETIREEYRKIQQQFLQSGLHIPNPSQENPR